MVRIRTLYVELTTKCNLSCRYCYNSSGTEKNKLDANALTNYCNSLLDYWDEDNKEVFLSGGEPLLHDQHIDILRNLHNLGFKLYLVTNGCLLNKNVASLIAPYISGIQISLDGSKSLTHDFFRGHGSFDKTVGNIKSLPSNILRKIRARITIGKDNYKDVIDFIDFCYSLGIAGVQFGLIRKQGRGCQKFEQIYDIAAEDVYNLKKLIDKKRSELKKSSFDVGIFDVEGGNCILSEDYPSIDMRIDSAGNVYPCHSLSAEEFCMGNIYDSLTTDIINGKKIQTILEKIKTRRQTMPECARCIWGGKLCHGGCPAEAYMMHGDIFHLDNKCQLRGKFWIDDIIKKRSINSKLYDC